MKVPDDGFDVIAQVVSQKGICDVGYKVGDEVRFCGKTIEGTTCIGAMTCLIPAVFALKYGATFPWEENQDQNTLACPDAANPVIFKVQRLTK